MDEVRRKVLCPKCKGVLGEGVYRDGRLVAMVVGNVRLHSMHGVCAGCGSPFIFTGGGVFRLARFDDKGEEG